MDHEEEFLSTFFTLITQLCFEKAKESVVMSSFVYISFIIFTIIYLVKMS